jgi:hypothetical protein
MHQEQFCRLTGIPLGTLRAIECGRRPMTFQNCRRRIEYTIGASFSDETNDWHSYGDEEPYQYRHYKEFNRIKPASYQDRCLRCLTGEINSLFAEVPPQRWFGLFIAVLNAVRDVREKWPKA